MPSSAVTTRSITERSNTRPRKHGLNNDYILFFIWTIGKIITHAASGECLYVFVLWKKTEDEVKTTPANGSRSGSFELENQNRIFTSSENISDRAEYIMIHRTLHLYTLCTFIERIDRRPFRR